MVTVRNMLLAHVLLAVLTPALQAQPLPFGSADDPWEQIQQQWWRRQNTVDVRGNLALIGPQWYVGGSVGTNLVLRSVTARLEASFYRNTLGFYVPYFDEPYDALRTISFARYNPPPDMPVYLRIGPLERVRMGTAGHLVNFFNSRVAWDERTIGAEFYMETPYGTISAFTDNVLFDGAVGAHYSARPMRHLERRWLASTAIGVTYVTDVRTWRSDYTTTTGVAVANTSAASIPSSTG